MKTTLNKKYKKAEQTDVPDITIFNDSLDMIDADMAKVTSDMEAIAKKSLDWQNPVYLNGFSGNELDSWVRFQYAKNESGDAFIAGTIIVPKTPIADWTQIFSLPVGYRPNKNIEIPVFDSFSESVVRIAIYTTGAVSLIRWQFGDSTSFTVNDSFRIG